MRSRIAARSCAGERVLHRTRRCVDRALRLRGAALRNAADERAVVRRQHVEPIACLDPLAVDEKLALGAVVATRASVILRPVRPVTRYARSGDVSIAYQVVGEGPLDLVFVSGWVSHLDHMWEEPSFARFLRRLASFSRLILFDKRGTGLSDRVPVSDLPTLEERMDDVRAVMDAAGSSAPRCSATPRVVRCASSSRRPTPNERSPSP